MNIILFEDKDIRISLLPLTYTRPVGDIRVGILKIAEKWQKHLNTQVSFLTEEYLSTKFPLKESADNILINGAVCPNPSLIDEIKGLASGEALIYDYMVVAARSNSTALPEPEFFVTRVCTSSFTLVDTPWSIFKMNASELKSDFDIITRGRKSANPGDPHTILYGKNDIFFEDGVKVKAAVINAESGPVYIGKNTEINEGALIRGAFALCEGAVLGMGAKIRGDSTVGPFSKVGGEISNSVVQGYSNKAHDGFIGNTVIGEWCNLGAGTNTSNLKNNYQEVKLWNYAKERFVGTGESFCGLIMGDHSKSSINTMFNTGTVVGVSANIFGAGFPRNYIPSFAWGGQAGFSTFKPDKVFEVAERVLERRNKKLDDLEKEILSHIYTETARHRFWEKK